MTSLRLMFIQLSQLTRCPLYVSPFFNSTNWGRKGNIYKHVENQRKEASLFAEFKCLTLTMGWFCAVRKSERGSYNQERAVKTYWIKTVSENVFETITYHHVECQIKTSQVTKPFLVTSLKPLERLSQTASLACCRMNSSKKRKDNSFNVALNNAKQIKSSSEIGSKLLNKFFLEEDFKVKFAKAFRYVESVKHLLFWDIILS